MDEWTLKMWCIYTHVHVCMYVCVYQYMHVCMCTYRHIYNGWMNKENVEIKHTHTMEYHSAIKKKEILPCDNMNGLAGYYANWDKSEKDK